MYFPPPTSGSSKLRRSYLSKNFSSFSSSFRYNYMFSSIISWIQNLFLSTRSFPFLLSSGFFYSLKVYWSNPISFKKTFHMLKILKSMITRRKKGMYLLICFQSGIASILPINESNYVSYWSPEIERKFQARIGINLNMKVEKKMREYSSVWPFGCNQ